MGMPEFVRFNDFARAEHSELIFLESLNSKYRARIFEMITIRHHHSVGCRKVENENFKIKICMESHIGKWSPRLCWYTFVEIFQMRLNFVDTAFSFFLQGLGDRGVIGTNPLFQKKPKIEVQRS